VIVVASVVLAANLTMLLVGSQNLGVSWDEPAYVDALAWFLASGWFVPRGWLVDGVAAPQDLFVHGPVASLLGHATAFVAGD
jgi:hypothetical protein